MSKEKTREIKVWVSRISFPKKGLNEVYIDIELPPPGYVEATLLIKEPEKTVTISESEYHQMTRDFDNPKTVGAYRFWYEKLFGSET